jgi:hypothetical protein
LFSIQELNFPEIYSICNAAGHPRPDRRKQKAECRKQKAENRREFIILLIASCLLLSVFFL